MLIHELKTKQYFPQPVQQALHEILEPIFYPGYRPGRSCHHAISKAGVFIRGEMKIISFIEELNVIENILRHLDFWDILPTMIRRKRFPITFLNCCVIRQIPEFRFSTDGIDFF